MKNTTSVAFGCGLSLCILTIQVVYRPVRAEEELEADSSVSAYDQQRIDQTPQQAPGGGEMLILGTTLQYVAEAHAHDQGGVQIICTHREVDTESNEKPH